MKKLNYKWFLGGTTMFLISIILFCILIFAFICTYVVDPILIGYVKEIVPIDPTPIEKISTQYLHSLRINIDIPITYRFVKYRKSDNSLLGTFHEWNNTYYIDINADLILDNAKLNLTVIHETRHLIIAYLKDKKIIDLEKYTEEIAQQNNSFYNALFDSGIYLYKVNEFIQK